jgi:hypothetical protein
MRLLYQINQPYLTTEQDNLVNGTNGKPESKKAALVGGPDT